ncbi:hypothetical protein [Xanthomonas arboricola]|uniref:hypothetical protein n=1 Tax=Xanthomonas arboricola TaxID=56448 RepID=UPI0012D3388B|nr:hypothetical protein [Xanthomonas arboricola]
MSLAKALRNAGFAVNAPMRSITIAPLSISTITSVQAASNKRLLPAWRRLRCPSWHRRDDTEGGTIDRVMRTERRTAGNLPRTVETA